MKKLFQILVSTLLLSINVNIALAQDAEATLAKVVHITGTATVLLPGETEAVPLEVGMSLPTGATIITGAASKVDVQAMAGSLTTISPNSSVEMEELSVNKNAAGVITKQTAVLSLKAGNLISNIDPNRKAINNYGVRTPKGVAAARGTVYAVTVNQTGSSVATLAGTVTMTPILPGGGFGTPIVVDIGTGMVISGAGVTEPTSLASLIAAESEGGNTGDGSMTEALEAAVSAVTDAVENNTISNVTATTNTDGTSNTTGVGNSDAAVSILSAIVNVASQANPNAAASYASRAVTAVTAPTSSVVVASGGATNASAAASTAAAAVTEAAVQGAVKTTVATATSSGTATTNAATVAQAITNAASNAAATSAARGGATASTTSISSAAAAGATTGTTQGNAANTSGVTATAPTVQQTTSTTTTNAAGQTTTTTTTTTRTATPTTTTPITPVDPSVVTPVSPSGGR